MRQQQGWQHGNQNNSRQNSQYIFPVEPSQKETSHPATEPYMTPPATQVFNSHSSNHHHDSTGEGVVLVAGDEEDVEAKDLRSRQESSSAIFMVRSQITLQTTVQRKRKPSKEWKPKRRLSWSVTQAGSLQQTNLTTPYL